MGALRKSGKEEDCVCVAPLDRSNKKKSASTVGFDFAEKARHGAGHFAIGHQGTFDYGPLGIVALEASGGDFGDSVFVGADNVSETETTRL